MTAFGDEHPDQPVGTNNKRIVMIAAAAGVVVASGLAAKAYFASHEDAHPPDTSASLYSIPPNDGRRFKTGYQLDEPMPAAPPPVLQAAPPPPMPLAAAAAPAAKPAVVPPKLRKSAFIGEWSQAAAPPTRAAGGQQGAPGGGAPSPGEYRPGMSDGHDGLAADAVQGQSAWKNRWMASAGTQGQDYVTAPWMPAISPTMIQAGNIIKAVAINESTSDQPGDVVAMVQAPVCNPRTGEWLLIPANTKLYGRYSNQVAPFQTTMLIAWNRILFPDDSSINIGAMPGVSERGSTGVEADVYTHTWGMAGAVGLAGLLSIIGQTGEILNATQGDGGTTAIGVVGGGAGGAGQATQSIGNKIISRQLDRPNTLTVHIGDPVYLLVSKDLPLPAYEGRRCGE